MGDPSDLVFGRWIGELLRIRDPPIRQVITDAETWWQAIRGVAGAYEWHILINELSGKLASYASSRGRAQQQ